MLRFRLAWLLILAFALTGCRGQVSKSAPIHPNWNMDQTVRIDAQEPSAFFADGRGNRVYPEGTVPSANLRGETRPCTLPESNPAFCQGKDEAGEWLNGVPSEVQVDAALMDRGHERYDIYCSPCHDRTARGDGMVARRGLVPPTLHNDAQRTKPLGQLYNTITNGGPIMPAYASQIPVEDRWAITAYVRALQISQHADLALVPADAAKKQGWK